MKIKIVVPTKVLLEAEVGKIIAEGKNGSFCLLPRHVDWVSLLTASILIFSDLAGNEQYLIHDEGVLVKCKNEVLIAIKHGWLEKKLGNLKEKLEKGFQTTEKEEEKTKILLKKLEADFMQRFLQINK